MAELFQKNKKTISEHIANIYEEGELSQEATVRKFRTAQKEGNREIERNLALYNLDVIISVGYTELNPIVALSSACERPSG